MRWELELIEFLSQRGFAVPSVVPTDDNQLHHEGVVVQRWIEGRPPKSETDWTAVAAELQPLHALTGDRARAVDFRGDLIAPWEPAPPTS